MGTGRSRLALARGIQSACRLVEVGLKAAGNPTQRGGHRNARGAGGTRNKNHEARDALNQDDRTNTGRVLVIVISTRACFSLRRRCIYRSIYYLFIY